MEERRSLRRRRHSQVDESNTDTNGTTAGDEEGRVKRRKVVEEGNNEEDVDDDADDTATDELDEDDQVKGKEEEEEKEKEVPQDSESVEDEDEDDEEDTESATGESVEDYKAKISELEMIAETIQNGTHEEFVAMNQDFESERAIKLKTAEQHRTLQAKNNNDLYSFSLQRAENLFQNGAEEIKLQLLTSTRDRLEKIQQELDELDNPPVKSTSVKLPKLPIARAPWLLPENEVKFRAEEFKDKLRVVWKEQMEPFNSDYFLKPDEIMSDLKAIYKDWKTTANRISVARPEKVQALNGKLVCRRNTYEAGDPVIVTSKFSGERFEGTISSVTGDAVYIDLMEETNRKVRVYVSHLVTKRCTIQPGVKAMYSNSPNCRQRKVNRIKETGWVK